MAEKLPPLKLQTSDSVKVDEDSMGVTVKIYDGLLKNAHQYHMKKEYAMCIVLAWSAAEIKTEQVLDQLFKQKNLEGIIGAIFWTNYTYNPCAERNYKILNALCGIEIQKDFSQWKDLRKSEKWRHEIVHDAKLEFSREQAIGTMDAVNDFSKYLEKLYVQASKKT